MSSLRLLFEGSGISTLRWPYVYSKEGKASLSRQGLTESDRIWDIGTRDPDGTRIAHAAATLQWGPFHREEYQT